MSKVERVYPEAKSGLINWIEENFHEIDSFIATFTLKDGTTMTVHHCNSVLEAFGIVGMTHNSISELASNGDFTGKGSELDE